MKHFMKLYNNPFETIKNGSKTIEMRLNDEKRSKIRISDTIEFINIETNELLNCVVTNLYIYKDFEELYKYHNKLSIGYKDDEIEDYKDMYNYYSKEQIEKYGVVGIEISIIE